MEIFLQTLCAVKWAVFLRILGLKYCAKAILVPACVIAFFAFYRLSDQSFGVALKLFGYLEIPSKS